jgi:hypothetical protein
VDVLVCLSWLGFFHHVGPHPDLVEEHVDESFFPRERPRALIGIALDAAAAVVGGFVAPPAASAIFFTLAVFYWLASQELSSFPRPAGGLLTSYGLV